MPTYYILENKDDECGEIISADNSQSAINYSTLETGLVAEVQPADVLREVVCCMLHSLDEVEVPLNWIGDHEMSLFYLKKVDIENLVDVLTACLKNYVTMHPEEFEIQTCYSTKTKFEELTTEEQ